MESMFSFTTLSSNSTEYVESQDSSITMQSRMFYGSSGPETPPYESAIRNNDKKSLELFIANGLVLDSQWYHQYHEGPLFGLSPAELCLKYGRLELLKFLAAQPSFTFPEVKPSQEIDRIWDSLVMFPPDYPKLEEFADYDSGKGECLEWLLDQNLYNPSLAILDVYEDLSRVCYFPSILRHVLQRGLLSINDIYKAGDPIWMEFGLYGPVESLRVMIDYINDVNRNGDEDGETLIQRLVRYVIFDCNVEIEKIKILVAAGGDINKPDHYGNTPLSCAENEKMRQALIDLGAIEQN